MDFILLFDERGSFTPLTQRERKLSVGLLYRHTMALSARKALDVLWQESSRGGACATRLCNLHTALNLVHQLVILKKATINHAYQHKGCAKCCLTEQCIVLRCLLIHASDDSKVNHLHLFFNNSAENRSI